MKFLISAPAATRCDLGAYEANLFAVTNTNDSGPGSLRQAILDSNVHPNVGGLTDAILFQIPGTGVKTIQPLTPPPAITDTILINGYTQTGSRANTLATGMSVVPATLAGWAGLNDGDCAMARIFPVARTR